MKIGVLGTGSVGYNIGTRLVQLGHEVMMGSRTTTNERGKGWVTATGKGASLGTFADAAKFGELIFNCTPGLVSLAALNAAGAANLEGKLLIDISNALDASKGMPPVLVIPQAGSMGEEIQKTFPGAKVVKTLNTMTAKVMVNPALVNAGDHHVFMSGNDDGSKQQAKEILKSFGWKEENILDLGDISTARGPEQILPLWIRLWGVQGTPVFQFNIVK